MDDRHRSLLRRHTVSFRRDLEPKKIIPYLVNVLDADDEQQIKNQPTREDQVDKMLDILPRRGPQAFRCFVESLESVQSHLGDLVREDEEMEKKYSEMKSELGRARSYSAKLRDELRVACVSLESEKNRQDNLRKELEELKSLHKALLHQSRNEKEKLVFNMSELTNAKERLTKDLEAGKQEKVALQNKCSKLEKELHSKNKEIDSLKIDFQRNSTPKDIHQLNSRKVSADEIKNREKLDLPRRRTNSERSERILTNGVNATYEGIDVAQVGGINNNIDVLYGQCEEMLECIQHNAEIMELERKLDHLTAEKDLALERCKKLEEEVKVYEEKRKFKIDRATTPMDDTGLNNCSKCIQHETDYKELQQANKEETHQLKEETRKIENTLKEVTDKYEREKKNLESNLQKLEGQYNATKEDFANEIKKFRDEMALQHDSEMKDLRIAKEELASQIERDKLTMVRLRSELDRERETIKTLNKDFDKYKKKANSEKKQLKKKLEDENKSKGSRLKDLEAELQEAKEEWSKSLDDISRLKATLKEQKDIQEDLRDELTRWKTLPGRVYNFKKEFDRNGIIYTLGTSFNTTPFINPASNDNCRIKVSRSSCDQGHPIDILDPRKGAHSCTADIEHSWWQVDLGEAHALFVTHYTLRHGRDNGLSILRNWNLEGSRDGRNWRILRKHDNDRGLKGAYPFYTGTWTVEGRVEAMRYFRIHQTGKNSSGRHALYLSGFEIYGVLLDL